VAGSREVAAEAEQQRGSAQCRAGVTWFGWHLPPAFEAGMVLLLGLAMMGVAIWQFSRTE
jgi:hypothetical protein